MPRKFDIKTLWMFCKTHQNVWENQLIKTINQLETVQGLKPISCELNAKQIWWQNYVLPGECFAGSTLANCLLWICDVKYEPGLKPLYTFGTETKKKFTDLQTLPGFKEGNGERLLLKY